MANKVYNNGGDYVYDYYAAGNQNGDHDIHDHDFRTRVYPPFNQVQDDDHSNDDFPRAVHDTEMIRNYYTRSGTAQAPSSSSGTESANDANDANAYLFVTTVFVCICINILLCCMVSWTRRNTRRQHRKRQAHLNSVEATLQGWTLMFARYDNDEDRVRLNYNEDHDSETGGEAGEGIPPEKTPSYEVVLKFPLLRRRGSTRKQNIMKHLQVVCNSGNEPNASNNHLRKSDGVKTSRERDTVWDTLKEIAHWDKDIDDTVALGLPFIARAGVTGLTNTLTLIVIGKLVGIQELSAYVVVRFLIEFAGKMVAGIHESLATLCGPAVVNEDHELVGQYVQLSIVFCFSLTLPIFIFWYCCMSSALRWFGLDDETVATGFGFAMILLIDMAFRGIQESLHALLDIIGYQSYSTIIIVLEKSCTFMITLAVAMFSKPSLQGIGIIQFFFGATFLVINCYIISLKDYFEPYLSGMLGKEALRNTEAAKLLLKTGFHLSFGYMLIEGEWGILAVFARFLGPASVVAWGILGELWDGMELLTEALGDAAEVRCSHLLGSRESERAKMLSYRTLYVGCMLAGSVSTFVFFAGSYIPKWITNDEVLQAILASIMPFFALGNLTLTFGQLCWAMLGAQGRNWLATATAFFGTGFVCIPLAAFFSLAVQFPLSGQTSAMVIGYVTSGSLQAYLLYTSDWESISNRVMHRTVNNVA
ncbi:Mate efflux family protein [Seminavis robusta]|uniref:Mate efflux family protein n=1 Tax=Seminavis robusta TaxID=568900 RepID=A0A9N8HP64_9STRA|nr:Mate efflux family protein [Seminavis robusta]|eukprot:Sro1149_g246540.1 Mate efflux family protein (704) ;mRNA; f:5767-8180